MFVVSKFEAKFLLEQIRNERSTGEGWCFKKQEEGNDGEVCYTK